MKCINIVKIKENNFLGVWDMSKEKTERDLFYILQDLKRSINVLDLNYLKDKLEVLNTESMHQEDNFDYYNRKYFLNNLKHLLVKILTLGKCSKKHNDNYFEIRELLEYKLNIIEHKYEQLTVELIVTEVLLDINTNKEVFYKNNFKQIDNFLEFIDELPKEEKQKIFEYKIGVNNG